MLQKVIIFLVQKKSIIKFIYFFCFCFGRGQNKLAKILIEKGCNINNTDNEGNSGLFYVIDSNNSDLCQTLLLQNKSKIDLTITNSTGLYAFDYVHDNEIFKLLNEFINSCLANFTPKFLINFSQCNYSKNKKRFLKLNKTIKDFEIINLLGRGSFGSVYLVCDKESDRYFALKALDKSYVTRKKKEKNLVKFLRKK